MEELGWIGNQLRAASGRPAPVSGAAMPGSFEDRAF
jgi:hypothetical protein